MKKTVNGFTLIELIIVTAIIGVLAAILMPSMLVYVKKARLKVANANAKIAYNAVAEYLADAETKEGRGKTTALYDFTLGNSHAGIDCTVEPASAADKVVYEAMSENGGEAGRVWVLGAGAGKKDENGNYVGDVTINGVSTFAVQWAKGTRDTAKIWGQYPNPISWSDYKDYIENNSKYRPGWYRNDWNPTASS